MPGKRITCQQYELYMKLKKSGLNQSISSAKAGFSERSARNLEKRRSVALRQKQKSIKRSNNPLETVWESTLVPLLEKIPNLTSRTLLEHLQDHYPVSS